MTEVAVRTSDIIATEINFIKGQARDTIMKSSIDIGKRLVEAKKHIPRGQWGKWLEESVDYSSSTANNLMKIYKEYGNSDAFGTLSYTQAVALLGVPAEDREAFVEENDVESMSVSQLQAAIKEKEALEESLAEEKKQKDQLYEHYKQEEELRKKAAEQNATLQVELEAAKKSGNKEAEKKLRAELKHFQGAANQSLERIAELEEKLKNAPIPDATAKELETLRNREKELSDQAKQIQLAAEKQLTDLQAQLKKNDNKPGIKFEESFKRVKIEFNAMIGTLAEFEDEELKEKYKGAIVKMLDGMKGSL